MELVFKSDLIIVARFPLHHPSTTYVGIVNKGGNHAERVRLADDAVAGVIHQAGFITVGIRERDARR